MRLSLAALGLATLAMSRVAGASAPGEGAATQAATGAAPAPSAAPKQGGAASVEAPPGEGRIAVMRRPLGPTFHVFGTLFFGEGFRFNNPYRLQTQLGDSAKTVSVTAPYVDLGAALAIGETFGFQHGAALNLTVAMSGVGQALLAPAYAVTYRGASARWMGYGRLGPSIILAPDANFGVEVGAGGAFFVTARAAVTAQLVGNLFYGAATKEAGFPVYPVLSLQLGLLLDHEVLP